MALGFRAGSQEDRRRLGEWLTGVLVRGNSGVTVRG